MPYRPNPSTQGVYEKNGLPMFMLFLDLSAAHAPDELGNIGGKSGGLKNNVLLEELRVIAKEHHERISFVYADGIAHADQMVSLGIFGGAERLPALAMNTKDGRQMVGCHQNYFSAPSPLLSYATTFPTPSPLPTPPPLPPLPPLASLPALLTLPPLAIPAFPGAASDQP